MKLNTPVALTATIAASLLLAGCATAVSTPAGSPAASPGSSPAPPASNSGKHIDICSAVPLATVVSITGKTYATTKDVPEQTAQGLVAAACGYNGSESGFPFAFTIQIFYGQPSAALTLLAQQDNDHDSSLTTSVSGIGDKALTDGSDDLAVQYGNDVIYLADLLEPPGTALVSVDAMKQLAELAHKAQQ